MANIEASLYFSGLLIGLLAGVLGNLWADLALEKYKTKENRDLLYKIVSLSFVRVIIFMGLGYFASQMWT